MLTRPGCSTTITIQEEILTDPVEVMLPVSVETSPPGILITNIKPNNHLYQPDWIRAESLRWGIINFQLIFCI